MRLLQQNSKQWVSTSGRSSFDIYIEKKIFQNHPSVRVKNIGTPSAETMGHQNKYDSPEEEISKKPYGQS